MPKETYYITTAIPYTNARPHIGHAYEDIITDLLVRWHELKGEDTFFLTGTDTHGQKNEKAAKEAGKTPKEFVAEMSAVFEELCKKLNIRNDGFIRTTDKKHVKTATEIWNKVYEKGLIYKGEYSGLYCTGCEAFYTEKELQDGLCPAHQKKAEQLSEESYFFKMSEFQERLVTHIKQHPDFILPEAKRNEIVNRLQEPLRDLSVTRVTTKWGVQVPQDKKHVMYVWFDALLNYISGISYPTSKFEKYWPANCHMIGRDITWFHTVIWPCILMAVDIQLPKTVFSHGFLTVNGQKMSKSLGNVIDPIYLADKYGADPIRYVLLREVPAGDDGDFSEKTLVERNNSDLADALGNLLQRTSVLVHKHFHGNIPICGELTENEKSLEEAIPDLDKLNELMDNYKWHHAIEKIWHYVARCNKYINDTEPWKHTQDPERLGTILYTLIEHLRIISILTWPIIPESAEKIAKQIGQEIGKFKQIKFTKETKGELEKSKILFEKLELKEEDPFAKLNLKVAHIAKVENHPDADKLYVLTLDVGTDETRQLVAGLREYYKPEELTGKHIVFISNLKTAKLRGVESQGMLLAADKDKEVKVLEILEAHAGDQVTVEGIKPQTQEITFEQFQKIKLTVKDKVAVYNDKPLKAHKWEARVDIPDGAKIR